MDFMGNFDVVLCQETWCLEEPSLNGYSTFALPALATEHGRAKGGLCILISSLLQSIVVPLPHYDHFVLTLLLVIDRFYCIIVNVHFPPGGTNDQIPTRFMGMESYLSHLISVHPATNITIGGDFNARI